MGWFWQHIVTASALKGKVWGKKVVIFTLVLFLCNAVMPFIWKENVKFRISVRFVALQLSPISASHGFELTTQSGQLRPQSFCYKMRFPNKYNMSGKKAIRSTFQEKEFKESQYWEEHISQSHKIDDMDKLSQIWSFCFLLLESKPHRPKSPRLFIAILVFV